MSNRKGMVQTVRGLLPPSQLGPTLMHEHLVGDYTPPDRRPEPAAEITMRNRWQMDYEWVVARGNVNLLDREVAVREMRALYAEGGRTLVDVSTPGLVPDPEGLRLVSERTGLNIVRSTGRYTQQFMNLFDMGRSVDDLVTDFVGEIETGYRDTGIRSGIIGEIGVSWPWTEAEQRSLRAAVIAQRHTGAALTIHPGRNPASPFDIIRLVKEAGADIPRTIMDHIERRLFRLDDVLRLADFGCVLEFDVFGSEQSRHSQNVDAGGDDVDLASDGVRVTAIRALIKAGHLERVLISHDIAQRTRQLEGGGHGYGHIFRNIVPMMRRRGFTQSELDSILIHNPARLLAFV